VLDSLSTHLSDYFDSEDLGADLVHISHTDIPDVLLQNRFLRLFAEPMDERAAFLEDPKSTSGEVHVATSASGALYERFELVLPRGSNVARDQAGWILINTGRFTLEIRTSCDGYVGTMSSAYNRYLGIPPSPPWESPHPRLVDIEVRSRPTRRAILSGLGWSYHRWIDTWLDALQRKVDSGAYLDRIGWPTVETMFQLMSMQAAGRVESQVPRTRTEDDT
jgi:hypothetical protein